VEEDFAANRQKFLAEQGYKYTIQHWTADEIAASQHDAARQGKTASLKSGSGEKRR
jgi:DNA excision repair protein ERCC-3